MLKKQELYSRSIWACADGELSCKCHYTSGYFSENHRALKPSAPAWRLPSQRLRKKHNGRKGIIMVRANGCLRFLVVAFAVATMAGCAAVETRPTLEEARLRRNQVATADDATLRPGETRAELMEVIPSRREIRVRTDDGRDRVMMYSANRITVEYHGWAYTVENLQSGDIIAFQTDPRNSNDIESIRVQEPVQSRTSPAPTSARPSPPSPRSNVIEGTVERIQFDRGIFDVRSRSGEVVTVSLPYSARAVEVESFRRLRNGDYVRIEGEFINRDNLQLDSFISPR